MGSSGSRAATRQKLTARRAQQLSAQTHMPLDELNELHQAFLVRHFSFLLPVTPSRLKTAKRLCRDSGDVGVKIGFCSLRTVEWDSFGDPPDDWPESFQNVFKINLLVAFTRFR